MEDLKQRPSDFKSSGLKRSAPLNQILEFMLDLGFSTFRFSLRRTDPNSLCLCFGIHIHWKINLVGQNISRKTNSVCIQENYLSTTQERKREVQFI